MRDWDINDSVGFKSNCHCLCSFGNHLDISATLYSQNKIKNKLQSLVRLWRFLFDLFGLDFLALTSISFYNPKQKAI